MLLSFAEICSAVNGRPRGQATAPITSVSTDSRCCAAGALFAAIVGERHDGHDHLAQAFDRGACAALVSCVPAAYAPGPLILVDDTVRALGRLAAAHRATLPTRVVAITGSNGKTTVKEMVGHILAGAGPCVRAERSFNNHLGVPLTLLRATPSDAFAVLELGSNAPGEIATLAAIARPHVAVITSIGAAHLAGFGDLAGVQREKLALLDALQPGGHAVVNVDTPGTRARLPGGVAVTTTGITPAADLRPAALASGVTGVRVTLADGRVLHAPLLGVHNGLNVLTAWATARACGLDDALIAERLTSVPRAPMRLEPLAYGRLTVINDCYNANPSSMLAALDVLDELEVPGRRVAVLGDMLELGRDAERLHADIGARVARGRIDVLLGIGPLSAATCGAARRHGRPACVVQGFDTLDGLQAELADLLRPDDTVLLKASRGARLERLLESLEDYGRRHGGTPSALRTV